MFRNFPCHRTGQIVRGTCYVRPPAKPALLWPLGCALPTPIASPDSPEFFSILLEMPLGNFTRIGQCYAPIT